MLLARMISHVVRAGVINMIGPDGALHRIAGERPGPEVTVRIHDAATVRRLTMNPHLALGEAYMDGTLTVEDGDIADLMRVVLINAEHHAGHWLLKLPLALDTLKQVLFLSNTPGRSKTNVAHHYDLSEELYALFLDRDRFYSCAYFPDGETDLERAQAMKAARIAAKLHLKPGSRVLDIGSGWGSLALHLARAGAERVEGVTLSVEQLRYARDWAAREHLDGRVAFELRDFRKVEGTYDRIVSVGMFEHVGPRHYPAFFRKTASLLAEDGVALLHSIGRRGSAPPRNAWIDKYIFPGGYIPALSEVMGPLERAGLVVTDVEILRRHYAETLKTWRARFLAARERIEVLYDARFVRMWDFYLSTCEMAFREGGLFVFQIQISKRLDALPLTRGYMDAALPAPERAVRAG
jgi:cyclopropane-fatty-acyl-phospholipid synthase